MKWANLSGLWIYGNVDLAEDEAALERMEVGDATGVWQLLTKILVTFCPTYNHVPKVDAGRLRGVDKGLSEKVRSRQAGKRRFLLRLAE